MVCDSIGFTITVNEVCRSTNYHWIDWTSTFANGNSLIKTMTGASLPECGADGTGAAWTYTVGFAECGILDPILSVADEDGIKWHTYGLYVNYDNAIASSQGTGNFKQLEQTFVECRIPSNLQKDTGMIILSDRNDLTPDEAVTPNTIEATTDVTTDATNADITNATIKATISDTTSTTPEATYSTITELSSKITSVDTSGDITDASTTTMTEAIMEAATNAATYTTTRLIRESEIIKAFLTQTYVELNVAFIEAMSNPLSDDFRSVAEMVGSVETSEMEIKVQRLRRAPSNNTRYRRAIGNDLTAVFFIGILYKIECHEQSAITTTVAPIFTAGSITTTESTTTTASPATTTKITTVASTPTIVPTTMVAPIVTADSTTTIANIITNAQITTTTTTSDAPATTVAQITTIKTIEQTLVENGVRTLIANNKLFLNVPKVFKMQSTSHPAYKDTWAVDAELGMTPDIIIDVSTIEEVDTQIIRPNETVKKVKDEIFRLKLETLDNFADVPQKELKNVFGDPMVESVNQYIITIDKCEAVTKCTNGNYIKDTCEQVQELDIPDLFTLQGDPPFQLAAFGLPKVLADTMELKFNELTKEVAIKISNLTLFEKDIYQNVTNLFIWAESISSKGLIHARLKESAKCIQFQKDDSSPYAINPSYIKEEVLVSFLLQLDIRMKTIVAKKIKRRLENVFNSVLDVDRITFLQFRDMVETDNVTLSNSLDYWKWKIVDFQILLKRTGLLNHNTTLEESISKGLRFTVSYNYDEPGVTKLFSNISHFKGRSTTI